MADTAKKKSPGGFACSKCGTWHPFSPYVAGHWDDVITHTCKCGSKHDLLRGVVTPQKPGTEGRSDD